MASYGKQDGFGRAVSLIARQYYREKDLVKWKGVYETVLEVVESVSEDEEGLWTGAAAAVANVHLGNDAAAEAVLDKMIADFNDHPDLPLALWRVADAYYYSGSRYQGAGLKEKGDAQVKMMVTLGQRLREKLPATDDTVEAWFFSGVASAYVDEYLEAIEYYQEVVDRWPAHRFAANAQYRVGTAHTYLISRKEISRLEGLFATKAAFEKLVDNYPNNGLASAARRWLDRKAAYFRGVEK